MIDSLNSRPYLLVSMMSCGQEMTGARSVGDVESERRERLAVLSRLPLEFPVDTWCESDKGDGAGAMG